MGSEFVKYLASPGPTAEISHDLQDRGEIAYELRHALDFLSMQRHTNPSCCVCVWSMTGRGAMAHTEEPRGGKTVVIHFRTLGPSRIQMWTASTRQDGSRLLT